MELWIQIEASDTPEWEPGKALEYLILRAFELEGANVTYPFSIQMGGTVLEQIDGAVYCDGFACLVECKDSERQHRVAFGTAKHTIRSPNCEISVIGSIVKLLK